jgi:hypothetical protein
MPFDETEFVDRDYPASSSATATAAPRGATSLSPRAPTREDLDAQVTATQQQLAKLREAQEQLERARSELEEMRRRRAEFQNGRGEMRDQLTRAVGLLENAEFESRRNAEQMTRSLEGLRGAMAQVEGLNEQAWTDADWVQQLSRALTVIETARMELHSARLKWPLIDAPAPTSEERPHSPVALADLPLGKLMKLGIAFTWPLVVLGVVAVVVLALGTSRR